MSELMQEVVSCTECGTGMPEEDAEARSLRTRFGGRCDSCQVEVEARWLVEEEEAARSALEFAFGRRLKWSGIPVEKAREAGGLLSAEHRALVDEWMTDGRGLLLTGDVGRGKTTIALAAALRCLEHGSLSWTTAPLLFARLGSGFQSEQRQWALDVLAGKQALVIDDLDKARPTEFGAEQMFLAIDTRVMQGSRLIVTTNLSPGELAAKWPEPYSEAIASRLVGYCQTVHVDGPDWRLA